MTPLERRALSCSDEAVQKTGGARQGGYKKRQAGGRMSSRSTAGVWGWRIRLVCKGLSWTLHCNARHCMGMANGREGER
jgi:hypothetical protein